jgi:hypothetical protein
MLLLSTSLSLFIAGILVFNWFFNRISKPLGKIFLIIGVPFGIYAIAHGIYLLLQANSDTFTVMLLILVGIALFSKPLKNIRWAALLATLMGVLLTYVVSQLFLEVPLIILIIAFMIITLMAYLLFKFAEDLIHAIGIILNFPPISAIIGALCFIRLYMLLIQGV